MAESRTYTPTSTLSSSGFAISFWGYSRADFLTWWERAPLATFRPTAREEKSILLS